MSLSVLQKYVCVYKYINIYTYMCVWVEGSGRMGEEEEDFVLDWIVSPD